MTVISAYVSLRNYWSMEGNVQKEMSAPSTFTLANEADLWLFSSVILDPNRVSL